MFSKKRQQELGVLAYRCDINRLLNTNLHVVYCARDRLVIVRNSHEVLTKLKKFCDDDALGLCSVSDNDVDVFIFVEFPPRPEVISHESFHATFRILEKTQTGVCGQTNEIAAFLTGKIASLVYEVVDEYRDKIRRNDKHVG